MLGDEAAMRVRSGRRLSISAATLLVLSTAFSCNYGDDDDDKKHKREKRVEAMSSQRRVVGCQTISKARRSPAISLGPRWTAPPAAS
jgi:hypothetical protein